MLDRAYFYFLIYYIHVLSFQFINILIMIFEPTVSQEQFEEKYEALLNQYNRIKDQVKEFGSSKNLDEEIKKIDQRIDEFRNSDSQLTVETSGISQNEEIQRNSLLEQIKNAERESAELTVEEEKRRLLLLEKIKEAETTLDQLQDREVLEQDDFKITKAGGDGTKEQNNEDQATIDLLEAEISKKKNELNQIQDNIAKLLAEIENREKQSAAKEMQILDQLMAKKKDLNQKEEILNSKKKQLEDMENTSNVAEPDQTQLDEQAKLAEVIAQIGAKVAAQQSELKKITSEDEKLKKIAKANSQNEKKLVNDLKSKKKELETAKNAIEEMKKERDNLNEERKKKKSKPGIDYKIEVMRFEKDNELLGRQVERQAKKLDDYLQLRKTYVKNDILIELKAQLDKINLENKSLTSDVKKLEKLQETNQHLTNSIKKLKGAQARYINEKETALNATKEKLKQLIESQTFLQRNIVHCKNKLSEYTKEYPNFEKDKQEAREKEKQRLINEKKIRDEELKQLRQERIKNKIQMEANEANDFDLPLLDVEKKDDSGNNQYLQIAGVAAVVLAGIGAYSMF